MEKLHNTILLLLVHSEDFKMVFLCSYQVIIQNFEIKQLIDITPVTKQNLK